MNKKGFTLIELLVTISILALIMIIAIPSIQGISGNIKEKLLKTKISEAKEAFLLWAQDNKNCIFNDYDDNDTSCMIDKGNCTTSENVIKCSAKMGVLAANSLIEADIEKTDGTSIKYIILNPVNNTDMSETEIQITYNTNTEMFDVLDANIVTNTTSKQITSSNDVTSSTVVNSTTNIINTEVLYENGYNCKNDTINNILSNGLCSPIRDDYRFDGWYLSDNTTKVGDPGDKNVDFNNAASITLFGKWTRIQYSVTLELNGGQKDSCSNLHLTINSGDQIGTLCTPTKSGYDFAGWKNQSGGAVSSTTIVKQNLELTASWDAKKYSLTYDDSGGTGCSSESKSLTVGTTIGDLCIPTRDAYKFIGWFTSATDGIKVNSTDTMPAQDLKVYAHWELAIPSTPKLSVRPSGIVQNNSNINVTISFTEGEQVTAYCLSRSKTPDNCTWNSVTTSPATTNFTLTGEPGSIFEYYAYVRNETGISDYRKATLIIDPGNLPEDDIEDDIITDPPTTTTTDRWSCTEQFSCPDEYTIWYWTCDYSEYREVKSSYSYVTSICCFPWVSGSCD